MRLLAILAVLLCGGAFAAEPLPGDRFDVRLADLPQPYVSESSSSQSAVVARPEGLVPRVPPGFEARL
jgi:hypothetical protein